MTPLYLSLFDTRLNLVLLVFELYVSELIYYVFVSNFLHSPQIRACRNTLVLVNLPSFSIFTVLVLVPKFHQDCAMAPDDTCRGRVLFKERNSWQKAQHI